MMLNKKYATHSRKPFFEIAAPYITPTSKVLDIGPGNAAFSDSFSRTDFYLFEGNPQTVTLLKEKHTHVYEGMLPRLPFEDRLFDVIHCSHVIEHLEPQVLYDSLKEMDRCLAPGGVLILSAPLMWEGFYNDLSHIRPYNPRVLVNYLCNPKQIARTRSVVSTDYETERLQYRYLPTLLWVDAYPTNMVGKFAMGIVKLFRRMGVVEYKKTGYTIVLRKKQ